MLQDKYNNSGVNMSKEKDGGAAFPCEDKPDYIKRQSDTIYHNGMSLRDYFAAKAMQGLLSDPLFRPTQDENLHEFPRRVADRSYIYADAMLKAREE